MMDGVTATRSRSISVNSGPRERTTQQEVDRETSLTGPEGIKETTSFFCNVTIFDYAYISQRRPGQCAESHISTLDPDS